MTRTFSLRRISVFIWVGAVMLSSCVESHSNAPAGIPFSPDAGGPQATESRMASGSSRGDLLYLAARPVEGAVYVYTYPQGRLVETLTGFYEPFGECTDAAGDVFVVALASASSTSSTIYEYAHGGSTPIASLNDPNLATGCAVDPLTGDLAASGEGVAIFEHASGSPKVYSSSEFGFYFCGYDDRGNLYLSASNGKNGGAQLVRLAEGSGLFEQIKLKPTLYTGSMLPSVQWDGKHIAVSSDQYRDPIVIYRLKISGTKATVVGSVTLSSKKNFYRGQLWIQNKRIIGTGGEKRGNEDAFFWRYPLGGSPRGAIRNVGNVRYPEVFGVTVSSSSSW